MPISDLFQRKIRRPAVRQSSVSWPSVSGPGVNWPGRAILPLAIALSALSLGGCDLMQNGFGEAGLDAELTRVHTQNGFAVLSKSALRAEIAAQGRRVRIAPTDGLCIAEESLAVVPGGAFAMIADCLQVDQTGSKTASFPGVVTISVSGKRGFANRALSSDNLEAMEDYLQTPAGHALLGRGADPSNVRIVELRQLGDALYIYVEDTGGDELGVFAARFWRALVRVNERLLLATVNGLKARPIGKEGMLSMLALQVQALRKVNQGKVFDDEKRVAEDARIRFAQTGSIVVADGAIGGDIDGATDGEDGGIAPDSSILPPRRLRHGETNVALVLDSDLVPGGEDETGADPVVAAGTGRVLDSAQDSGQGFASEAELAFSSEFAPELVEELTRVEEANAVAVPDDRAPDGGELPLETALSSSRWAPNFSPIAPQRPG